MVPQLFAASFAPMPKAMAAPMTAASARPVGREGRVGVHKVALQCRERRVRVWKNAQHAFSALGSRLLLDRRAYRGAVVHHIAHGARAATGGAAVGTPRKCFSPNGSAPRAAAAVPHGTQPAESQGEDWPETPPPPGVSSVRRSRRTEGIFARPLSQVSVIGRFRDRTSGPRYKYGTCSCDEPGTRS